MPIATPEDYAEMLDTAKAERFAYPAINVSSSQTLNAALQGFADAGSDGIVQVSTGGAEYLSGPTVKDMVTGVGRVRGVRARGRQELPGQHRAAHRPLPEGQARRLRPAAARDLAASGSRAARTRCSSRTCGTAPPCRWTRTSRSPQELLAEGRGREDHPRDRGRRGRRRGGRRRRRDRRQALHHPRGRAGHGRGARPRREGPLPDGADLRQRARRLQARQRQAPPGDPQGRSRRRSSRSSVSTPARSRSTWSSTAAPARSPRRSRAAVDYGVVKMNVDTDTQYAFTRPVAEHMFKNYDGVLKVDGEVGNKKAYDPRAWGKAGRGRHGRPRRRGLREPALGREVDPADPAAHARQPGDSAAVRSAAVRSGTPRHAAGAAGARPWWRGCSKNSTPTRPSTSTDGGQQHRRRHRLR